MQGKGKTTVYGLDHVHRAFSNFKTWLSGTHNDAVLPKHVQAYCNEFVFRHNRRDNPWSAFNRCLGMGTEREAWPEYQTLYDAGLPGGCVHPNPKTGAGAAATLGRVAALHADPALADWLGEHRAEVETVVRKALDPRSWEKP